MLTLFALRKTYCKLTIRLMVDCDLKDASVTIVYEARIRRMERVDYWKVDTIEKAQAWLGQMDIESMELLCRRDPDFMKNIPPGPKLAVDNLPCGR